MEKIRNLFPMLPQWSVYWSRWSSKVKKSGLVATIVLFILKNSCEARHSTRNNQTITKNQEFINKINMTLKLNKVKGHSRKKICSQMGFGG